MENLYRNIYSFILLVLSHAKYLDHIISPTPTHLHLTSLPLYPPNFMLCPPNNNTKQNDKNEMKYRKSNNHQNNKTRNPKIMKKNRGVHFRLSNYSQRKVTINKEIFLRRMDRYCDPNINGYLVSLGTAHTWHGQQHYCELCCFFLTFCLSQTSLYCTVALLLSFTYLSS